MQDVIIPRGSMVRLVFLGETRQDTYFVRATSDGIKEALIRAIGPPMASFDCYELETEEEAKERDAEFEKLKQQYDPRASKKDTSTEVKQTT